MSENEVCEKALMWRYRNVLERTASTPGAVGKILIGEERGSTSRFGRMGLT